jgi:glycosyltransferase involved in cell wall biosynthesis
LTQVLNRPVRVVKAAQRGGTPGSQFAFDRLGGTYTGTVSPAGVNLVGYLNHVVGLGESARQFEGALRAAGIPHAVAAIDLGEHAPRLHEARAPWLADAELPFDVTVLWCNPDRYGIDVDPAAITGRRLVGRWAWELSQVPADWTAAADWFCEIWTPSRFVRDAVSTAVALPVRVIPNAVEVPPVPVLDRRSWNVAANRLLFLFVFDHHSTVARKNPVGLIRAFADAFPDGREATLLIKSINAANLPEAAAELQLAASEHPAVQVVDLALTASERLALIAGCDCYVSLHRSEGFGMTIAEAMAYARPVIATDYGGCVDFLDADNGYLVSCRPARVGVTNSVYPADGIWAEPDQAHAARLIRQVAAAPDEAKARGRRAARRIAVTHSPEAVGRGIARELTRLAGLT